MDPSPKSAWGAYRRLRNSYRGAVITWLALIPVIGLAPAVGMPGLSWWLIILPVMLWFLIANIRIGLWPCPRCSRPYFTRGLWIANILANRCYYCGLRKWADPSAAQTIEGRSELKGT